MSQENVEALRRIYEGWGARTGSGVPTELRYFQVWTFRGGSVIRIESIRNRDDALATVGLAP